jgi:Ca2+-binding EF-hand superfamily protein
MTMRWFVLLLSCVLLVAHTASGADKPLDKRAVIQSADTNGDGRIDRVEFHQRTTEAFFFIDANKDGFLTTDELLAAVPGADPQRIKAADRNGDGKIDIYEYHRALSRDFDAADTNDDGVLDVQEVERMWSSAAR